ncbi:hypothetical protein MUK42_16433 [Musa troglodytarum]|uniref:NAC domain-containing protein n=1 Tax=Musa troglodytarum TaxID=320322 RepID=A0A9E7FB87_9LILI|nr:hypothetical protein MUK42_16433 [Musa troglodytarum]
MHEYRLHPSLYETIPSYETEEIILCRIQHKGRGAADKSDGDSLPDTPPVADTQQTPEPWMAGPSTQSMAIDVPGCSWDQCGVGATADLPPRAWQLTSLGVLGINVVSELRRDLPPRAWQLTSWVFLGSMWYRSYGTSGVDDGGTCDPGCDGRCLWVLPCP